MRARSYAFSLALGAIVQAGLGLPAWAAEVPTVHFEKHDAELRSVDRELLYSIAGT